MTEEKAVLLFSKDTVAETMNHLQTLGREQSIQYGLDLVLLGLMQLSGEGVEKKWIIEQYPTQIKLAEDIVDMLIEMANEREKTDD